MSNQFNIWKDKDFDKLAKDIEHTIHLSPLEDEFISTPTKKRNTISSKEAKKIAKWREGLKEIVKKPMMIEKHIHIRMKRYCVDKEVNIFDYTCDLIDKDLKKNGY